MRSASPRRAATLHQQTAGAEDSSAVPGTWRTGDPLGRTLLAATLIALYPRIYFGFSFFDEAYYLALPAGFLAGHAPFVEERALPQLAALLIQPFVALWIAIVGSNDGLVLFARHLYFAASVGAAFVTRTMFRAVVGERFANLAAALVLVYVPFCLFALSYNTITLFGLLLGGAGLVWSVACEGRARSMAWTTLCFAMVSFSYPPMLFVALPALGLGLWQIHSAAGGVGLRDAGRGVALGGAIAVTLLGGLLLALGFPAAFDEILAFSRAQAVQGGGWLKLRGMLREIFFQQSFLALLAASLLLLLVPLSLRPTPRFAVAGAVLVGPAIFGSAIFYREFHSPYTALPFALTLLGLAAPLAFALARERFDSRWRRGMASYIAVSVASGLAIWWATSNGLRNAALGFTPAALATLACLALPSRLRDPDEGARQPPPQRAVTVAMISLVAFGLIDLWTHAYRERPPAQLEVAMTDGPWKGIRTTQASHRFLRTLDADLASVRETERFDGAPASSVFFYDYFPAGYLLSDLRPRASTLWTFPVGRIMQGTLGLRETYVAGLREQEELPDLLVRLACIPSQPRVDLQYRAQDPLPVFFDARGYEAILERRCYRIERR